MIIREDFMYTFVTSVLAASMLGFSMPSSALTFEDGSQTAAVQQVTISTGANSDSKGSGADQTSLAGEDFTSVVQRRNHQREREDIANVGLVPEPESYAMLIAGLVVIGFGIRQRQQAKNS